MIDIFFLILGPFLAGIAVGWMYGYCKGQQSILRISGGRKR